MGKKNYYGDPRIQDQEFFGDILTEENPNQLSRKELEELYKNYDVKTPEIGKVANVVYVGTSCSDFVFDAGFKDYVRIEDKPGESKYLVNTNIGDTLDILVTEIDETNYQISGSIAALYESKARHSLTNLDYETPVTVKVKDLTPAGYSVDIYYESVTLPGFMPNTLAGINKLSAPEAIIGQTFEVMIESFSNDEGTYIVSRRRYLQTLIPQAIKQLMNNVVYEGTVTGTTSFGIFVEFKDCLTGMIHKTNLNPELQERISEVLPGMIIQFYIKEIIKDKIILTQVLKESLWDSIKVNQTITGKVRDVKSFGVLVSLDEETNGLIHTSELEKASKKFQSGDEVKVRIIAVDRMNRKIFLSVAN
jgi:ribosomal protein S1